MSPESLQKQVVEYSSQFTVIRPWHIAAWIVLVFVTFQFFPLTTYGVPFWFFIWPAAFLLWLALRFWWSHIQLKSLQLLWPGGHTSIMTTKPQGYVPKLEKDGVVLHGRLAWIPDRGISHWFHLPGGGAAGGHVGPEDLLEESGNGGLFWDCDFKKYRFRELPTHVQECLRSAPGHKEKYDGDENIKFGLERWSAAREGEPPKPAVSWELLCKEQGTEIANLKTRVANDGITIKTLQDREDWYRSRIAPGRGGVRGWMADRRQTPADIKSAKAEDQGD